jgi:hypothetical protein
MKTEGSVVLRSLGEKETEKKNYLFYSKLTIVANTLAGPK